MTKRETQRTIERMNVDERKFTYSIERAMSGITGDARQVLKWCARCIEEGVPLPKAYAEFIARRFNEISDDADPFDESLFKRKKGDKGRDEIDGTRRIAHEVWALHKNGGKNLPQACEIVANRSGGAVTFEDAKAAYNRFRRIFSGEDTESRDATIERAGRVAFIAIREHDQTE
jgi:hypothetical protein